MRLFALPLVVAGMVGACVTPYGTTIEAPPNGGGDAVDAASTPNGDASDGAAWNGDASSGADASNDDASGAWDAFGDVQQGEAGPAGGCFGAVDCERVVFETSSSHMGNLGGLAGADALCQKRADESLSPRIVGRTFRAWIGSATTSAASRHVHGTKPYVRRDLTVVATSYADLTDGTLAAPINIDEQGVFVGGGVWTDTTPSGGSGSAGDCSAWTSVSSNVTGGYGSANNTDALWTAFTSNVVHCNLTMHLYCIEY